MMKIHGKKIKYNKDKLISISVQKNVIFLYYNDGNIDIVPTGGISMSLLLASIFLSIGIIYMAIRTIM